MKKSFMTRILATGLSFAMAFSMAAATNVTTASAAVKKASVTSFMKASSKTVVEGKTVTTYMKSNVAKKYRIKKHTESTVAKKYISVENISSRKGLKITAKEGALAAANLEKKGVNVKIYFAPGKSAAAAKKATATKYVNLKVVVKAAAKEEEKPDTTLAIESVVATKVNELTVTFKNPVATSGTSIAVTKGSNKVATSSETWATDGKSLVIKTTANMINGTYTVTVKNATEEATGTAEVTSQHVDAIKILNTVALTDAIEDITPGGDGKLDDATGVYVYYDVVDQYGESMKNSTTIDWSTSCKVKKNDKTNGVLTLTRTDSKAFTYGESIYVTGVHAKTGKSVSATLTVGAKQALNTVEVKGFVKKGTSEILKSLPAGFKSQAYYLVYSVLDQNGNKMAAKKYMGSEADTDAEVTFISDNILVLKEITKDNETVLTLDGEEYCAAFLVPGIDVNKGGEVNITAIANKTGNKSNINVVVGNSQILKSFTMSQPSGVVADGEWVEIPFVALDQNGEEIKNFVTLASQSDFNRLQLNASYGSFTLSENDDGTACLSWRDDSGVGKDGRWNANSEDGIDRPISLTAVVIGGETCNEMLYVQDKAMPVAIKSVDVNSVYVQDSTAQISLSSFTFVDQYGRTIDDSFTSASGRDSNTENANKGYIWDNGFFAYANGATGLSGTEFNDQKFGIAVEFKGEKSNLKLGTEDTDTAVITGPSIKYISDNATTKFKEEVLFTITDAYDFTVCADQTLKFSIVKIDDGDAAEDNNYSNVSPIKNHTFKGVNIDRVSGFEIKDLNTFYVNTPISGKANAAVHGVTTGGITGIDAITGASIGNNGYGNVPADTTTDTNKYYQKVKVTGKFNGVTVDVPKKYFTVAGSKLGTSLVNSEVVSTAAINENVIDSVAVSTSALKTSDLYDANSAQFTRKLAEDTLKVTVYKATSGSGVIVTDTAIVNTATKKVAISDATPYAATICAADAYTVQPRLTTISNARLVSPSAFDGINNTGLLKSSDSKAYLNAYYENSYWKVLDQYGVEIDQANVGTGKLKYAFKITDVKENADRYADNNFAVDKNDTKDASIKGAECGDTFVLTISASYGGATATKEIKITIGGDYYSVINTTQNAYTEVLVDKDGTGGLEYQRTEALGKN